MSEIVNNNNVRKDKVRISDEVIGIIAGIAAADVENVTSLSGGFVEGIASILGRKNLGKGVKVQSGEKEVIIEVSIVVEYGCKIHMVAKKIQDRVREAVENMTDLNVSEVDVNVVGVNVEKDFKKSE